MNSANSLVLPFSNTAVEPYRLKTTALNEGEASFSGQSYALPALPGDKLKIYHLARKLAAKGHELHLLTFALNAEDLSYKAALEEIFHRVTLVHLPKWKSALNCLRLFWDARPLQVLYFQSGAMRKALAQTLAAQPFDAVHVQHLRMAPYLATQKSVPRILDLPDAFSLYWQRRAAAAKGFASRAFQRFEQRRLLRYEPVMREYDLALACSEEDVSYLEETHCTGNVHLLPNGVDLDQFYPRPHDYGHHHTLLFTGNMDYAPNVDAAVYFVKEILPLVRRSYPEVQFVIAGQRPVAAVQELALVEGVSVTGFVPDLAGQYDAASVVVAPLRFGAGTQNKVLEAMAMGVPVVCTAIGWEGLGIADGAGAFCRRDAAGFAAQVVALLNSTTLRRSTGEQGSAAMQARFGWDAIAAQLEHYFEQIRR